MGEMPLKKETQIHVCSIAGSILTYVPVNIYLSIEIYIKEKMNPNRQVKSWTLTKKQNSPYTEVKI